MICRKCGAELPDNTIRCNNCGIKVNMMCPECKTLNLFGTRFCKNCGFELIKICPNCHSSNIYSAEKCRKCSAELTQSQPDLDIVEPISSTQTETVNESEEQFVAPIHQQDEIIIPVVSDFNNVNYFDEQPTALNNNDNSLNESNDIKETAQDVNEIFDSLDSSEQNNNNDIEDYNDDKEQTQNEEIIINNDFSEKEQDKVEVKEEEEKEEEQQTDNEESFENNVETPAEKSSDDILLSEDFDIEPLEETEDITLQEEYEEVEDNSTSDIEEENSTQNKYEIQKETVKETVQLIKTSLDKHIIGITGAEGCGKSAVLKQVSNILHDDGYISLYGNCTPLSQITSFGFFQDAFLRMMGFPPYTNSSEAFIKDFKKSDFVTAFNFLNNEELTLFLNIFYPFLKDSYENILDNKQLLFSILEKVIKSFLVSANVIITIDNFELLDGASYDFIMYLMNKNFFNNRLKLLAAFQENKSIQSYFDITNIDEKVFETFYIDKLTKEELIETVSNSFAFNIEEVLPKEELEDIILRTDGNAIRMEQELAFLFDINYICFENNEIFINEENKPYNNPNSAEELIKLRLNTLMPGAKNVLFMAAIMGYRFATNILCLSVSMPENKAAQVLEFLKQELFISNVDNFTCEFKSLSIWKLIYQEAKTDLLFKENCQRLYNTLKNLILSSNLQKLISCKDALNKKEEFVIWQDTADIATKLGDTNLFVIAQKQCLKILEEQELPDSEKIRAIIYEQIGKLLSDKSPTEAVTYLANVLDAEIKSENINKIIDISGYFINSCYKSGNYFGATEAVDAIVSNINNQDSDITDTDIALIQTRKLKSLLNIGNSEQIINLVREEILPEIDKALEEKPTDINYKNILTDAWLLSAAVLAKALALQGNSDVYNVIELIKDFILQYDYKTEYYTTQTELIEAFANSTTGNINNSNEILTMINERYSDKQMETNLLAEWNLINIINRVFSKQTEDLKADLFELAAFSNNINEHFIKNIIKLILGYVLQEEKNTKKALTIFNEEITYFAKEKVAIGALLSWALIVQISIDTDDIDKALNTATKALEIAQSPKINNFFFIIYFQKFLAEIYMIKNDLIAVKMYLEKAIMLAKQYNLKYQLTELYISYGKYMEEYMNIQKSYGRDNVKLTVDIYNKAVNLAKELQINHLIEKSTRERSAFKTYCQLKSIEL